MERIRKAIAYVTRGGPAGAPELLVFEHRDYPEAGTQVPAGTLDEGETPEDAAVREVEEESGLEGCRLLKKLAVCDWPNPETGQMNERHVFHLAAPPGTAEKWTWVETDGGIVSELEGYVFQFRWIRLDGAIELAGNQGDFLHLIR
jgi:ADP-ribose pyrophosphatase YjhB (NUDIX family)